MVLATSGNLSLGTSAGTDRSIQAEFGGSSNTGLTDYRRGGGLVPAFAGKPAANSTFAVTLPNTFNTGILGRASTNSSNPGSETIETPPKTGGPATAGTYFVGGDRNGNGPADDPNIVGNIQGYTPVGTGTPQPIFGAEILIDGGGIAFGTARSETFRDVFDTSIWAWGAANFISFGNTFILAAVRMGTMFSTNVPTVSETFNGGLNQNFITEVLDSSGNPITVDVGSRVGYSLQSSGTIHAYSIIINNRRRTSSDASFVNTIGSVTFLDDSGNPWRFTKTPFSTSNADFTIEQGLSSAAFATIVAVNPILNSSFMQLNSDLNGVAVTPATTIGQRIQIGAVWGFTSGFFNTPGGVIFRLSPEGATYTGDQVGLRNTFISSYQSNEMALEGNQAFEPIDAALTQSNPFYNTSTSTGSITTPTNRIPIKSGSLFESNSAGVAQVGGGFQTQLYDLRSEGFVLAPELLLVAPGTRLANALSTRFDGSLTTEERVLLGEYPLVANSNFTAGAVSPNFVTSTEVFFQGNDNISVAINTGVPDSGDISITDFYGATSDTVIP